MIKNNLVVSMLIIVSTFLTNSTGDETNKVQNYFDRILKEYSNYLTASNLDPSPPHPHPITFNLTSPNIFLDANISGYQVHNHSNRNFSVNYRSANLSNKTLEVEFYVPTEGLWIDGNYTANGTWIDSKMDIIPIRGKGKWKAYPTGKTFYVGILYHAVNLTWDGYVNLKNAEVSSWLHLFSRSFEMDGLSAGGHEPEVRNMILSEMFLRTDNSGLLPLQSQLHEYLVKAFEVTPISKM